MANFVKQRKELHLEKYLILIFMFILSFHIILICGNPENEDKDLVTVNQVDLEKYTGLWYEIARIPNRFQKQCAKNTTAEYSLREDGKIKVVNRCLKENGEVDDITGIAKIADPVTNAKLKVSFVRFLGISLFWADYWIIGLAEDYRWAIVGTPSRKYGWILAREPRLSPEVLSHINQKLSEQGYNPEVFIKSTHQLPNIDSSQ